MAEFFLNDQFSISTTKHSEGMSYEDIIEDLTYRINDIANVVHEKYFCAGEAVRQSITTFYLWAISIIFLIMMNMM